jgi:hypothetical protein
LALVLPNGIALCYGPVSVRRNDNRVLDWSEADEYFHQLFQANLIPDNAFAFYGDSIFVGPRHCFRTKMVPLVAGLPLPEQYRGWNHAMSCVREEIEHYYGSLSDLWHLARSKHLFRLGSDPNVVKNEIRMMFLLTNIHGCLRRGNTVSSVFELLPPTIDEYLIIVNQHAVPAGAI